MAGLRRLGWAVLGLLVLALLLVLPALPPVRPSATPETAATAPPSASPSPTAVPAGYRAVWISYLEWQQWDFSSAQVFSDQVSLLLDNLQSIGANVLLAHLRPFGDALYPSSYYPFSDLCTGIQGQDPGYDPLALLLEAAHARGIQVEGWINPYRIQAGGSPVLCEASPALVHPDWVREVNGDLYLNPADPAVRDYIAGAVAELCQNYPIDGIHFDDYFYPTTDPAFDAADYAAAGTDLSLEDWRRENVNALIRLCHQTAAAAGVRFGVAPQGDPDSNYAGQYSDVALWLSQPGYVDYLMPQLYWGLDYTLSGDSSHSLATLAGRWAALDRAEGVSLYFGLGAYRIGEGDGGDLGGPGTEWQSGAALAGQVTALAQIAGPDPGIALYRYDSLFANRLWPTLAAQERTALAAVW